MEEWITTTEAARLSGYSLVHIRRLIWSETIKAQRWGRDWMIDRDSLMAYIEKIGTKGNKRGPKTKEI